MVFIETSVFTRMILALLRDDEYRQLQIHLMADPQRGDLLVDGGGIRKLRWSTQGRGKSSGVRVIYYWKKENVQIYMLAIYPKSIKDNLTSKEAALLRNLVKEI